MGGKKNRLNFESIAHKVADKFDSKIAPTYEDGTLRRKGNGKLDFGVGAKYYDDNNELKASLTTNTRDLGKQVNNDRLTDKDLEEILKAKLDYSYRKNRNSIKTGAEFDGLDGSGDVRGGVSGKYHGDIYDLSAALSGEQINGRPLKITAGAKASVRPNKYLDLGARYNTNIYGDDKKEDIGVSASVHPNKYLDIDANYDTNINDDIRREKLGASAKFKPTRDLDIMLSQKLSRDNGLNINTEEALSALYRLDKLQKIQASAKSKNNGKPTYGLTYSRRF